MTSAHLSAPTTTATTLQDESEFGPRCSLANSLYLGGRKSNGSDMRPGDPYRAMIAPRNHSSFHQEWDRPTTFLRYELMF